MTSPLIPKAMAALLPTCSCIKLMQREMTAKPVWSYHNDLIKIGIYLEWGQLVLPDKTATFDGFFENTYQLSSTQW